MKDTFEFSMKRRATVRDSLAADRAKLMEALREKGAGSALRGWRRELDPDGSLDLGYQEFCQAMDRLGVEVDTMRLFGADGDFAKLTLEELAPPEGRLVERFREWVKTRFGSPTGMFSAVDSGDKGVLGREEFVSGCRTMGFEASGPELSEVFNLLDVEDFGTITEQDIMFLETDKQARELEIFRAKMRSKHQRQRLLAYVYWDDRRRITKATDRRACRPWLGHFRAPPRAGHGQALEVAAGVAPPGVRGESLLLGPFAERLRQRGARLAESLGPGLQLQSRQNDPEPLLPPRGYPH